MAEERTPAHPPRRPSRRRHHHTLDQDHIIYIPTPPQANELKAKAEPPSAAVPAGPTPGPALGPGMETDRAGERGPGGIPDPERDPAATTGAGLARFEPVFSKVEAAYGVEWEDEQEPAAAPHDPSRTGDTPRQGLVTFSPVPSAPHRDPAPTSPESGATGQRGHPGRTGRPGRPETLEVSPSTAPPSQRSPIQTAPPAQSVTPVRTVSPVSPAQPAQVIQPQPRPVSRPFVPTTVCPNCFKQFTLNLRFQYTECPWCGFAVARPR